MKRKICPYCDQTMEGNYCRGCRRFVGKPISRDVDYYLNERHPADEQNCQYHGDLHTGDTGAKRKNTGNAERKKILDQERAFKQKKASKQKNTLNADRKKRSVFSKVLPVIVVYLVFMVAVFLFQTAMRFDWDDLGTKIPESAEPFEQEPWEETALAYESEILEDWERSVEDVKTAGIPCNGYGHFEVGEETVREGAEKLLLENGYEVTEPYMFSYNQFHDQTTWYNTEYEYDLMKNGEYLGHMDLQFDTADGRLHGARITTYDKASMDQAAELVVRLFAEMGIMTQPIEGGSLYDEIKSAGESDGHYFPVMMYDVEMCIAENEGEYYWLEICAPGYYFQPETALTEE